MLSLLPKKKTFPYPSLSLQAVVIRQKPAFLECWTSHCVTHFFLLHVARLFIIVLRAFLLECKFGRTLGHSLIVPVYAYAVSFCGFLDNTLEGRRE